MCRLQYEVFYKYTGRLWVVISFIGEFVVEFCATGTTDITEVGFTAAFRLDKVFAIIVLVFIILVGVVIIVLVVETSPNVETDSSFVYPVISSAEMALALYYS